MNQLLSVRAYLAWKPRHSITELFHIHLPKLEEMGYITWDQNTNQISKGPKWDEIAPLLQLIYNHQDELPDKWL